MFIITFKNNPQLMMLWLPKPKKIVFFPTGMPSSLFFDQNIHQTRFKVT